MRKSALRSALLAGLPTCPSLAFAATPQQTAAPGSAAAHRRAGRIEPSSVPES